MVPVAPLQRAGNVVGTMKRGLHPPIISVVRRPVRRSRRSGGVVLISALMLCARSMHGIAAEAAEASGGPKVGDHWHMAFGIWNCGKWEPSPAAGDDPIGIHTHGDGLIHIHPFVSAAAGANAVLAKFLDIEKIKVTSAEIDFNGRALKAGTTCKGKKATVRTLWWDNRNTKTPKVLTTNPSKTALKDQAIVVLALGAADASVGLPPSLAELEDPADLAPPALSASGLAKLPAPPSAIPTVEVKGEAPKDLRITDRVVGGGKVATKGTRPYVRFALYLWRTGALLDRSTWKQGEQPAALGRLGKGSLLPGIEKGLVGMKVGGLREIVLPPSEGFGVSGSPPVLGTDTLVMVVQLVDVVK